MQLQVMVYSARQGRDVWNLSKFKHDLICAIREEGHSFFFVLCGELDIEPQRLLIPVRHLDGFLDTDSYMLYFELCHGLIFLHNDIGQQRAVACLVDANCMAVWFTLLCQITRPSTSPHLAPVNTQRSDFLLIVYDGIFILLLTPPPVFLTLIKATTTISMNHEEGFASVIL